MGVNVHERYVFFTDDIDESSMGALNYVLNKFIIEDKSMTDKIEPIHLYISSNGGNIVAGLNVIDTMLRSTTPIYTYCQSWCASMGAIVFISGNIGHRYIGKYGRLLLHEASYSANDTLQGHKDCIKVIEKSQYYIDSIIFSRSSMSKDQLNEYRKNKLDMVLNARESIKYKLADKILK